MDEFLLSGCPLFAGIEKEQIHSLLQCLTAKHSVYKKDGFIFRADERARYVGIVLAGGANVIQEDFWGNRTILTHVGVGELFGEAFSCAEIDRLPVSVIATQPSQILLIDYRKIVTVCSCACVFHSQLISNMLRILANKNIFLTQKMGHLSKRSTREKVLAFLSAKAVDAKDNHILIPFDRQELADYLCVERAALSRELSAMKKDGLLTYHKNRFTLL